MPPPIKLFLNYAREDQDAVAQLYSKLRDCGYEPWIDIYNLKPGGLWELAIYKEIRGADLFLACLSCHAVRKRGMLQKELKKALDIWNEKLDGDIYLIPVRLEECEIPESLSKFQWVDIFKPDGFDCLCSAIETGVNKQRADAQQCSVARAGIALRLDQLQDSRTVDPIYDIHIQFPHFDGPQTRDLSEVNTQIKALISHEAQLCRGIIFAGTVDIGGETVTPCSVIDGLCQVTLVTTSLISVMFDYWSYNHPAAHPTRWRTSCNYSLNPVVALDLDHIFDFDRNNSAPLLARIRQEFGEVFLGIDDIDDIYFFDLQHERHGMYFTGPQGSFNIGNDKIIFSYVGPFALGVLTVEIPFEDLRSLVNPHGPLACFVK